MIYTILSLERRYIKAEIGLGREVAGVARSGEDSLARP